MCITHSETLVEKIDWSHKKQQKVQTRWNFTSLCLCSEAASWKDIYDQMQVFVQGASESERKQGVWENLSVQFEICRKISNPNINLEM